MTLAIAPHGSAIHSPHTACAPEGFLQGLVPHCAVPLSGVHGAHPTIRTPSLAPSNCSGRGRVVAVVAGHVITRWLRTAPSISAVTRPWRRAHTHDSVFLPMPVVQYVIRWDSFYIHGASRYRVRHLVTLAIVPHGSTLHSPHTGCAPDGVMWGVVPRSPHWYGPFPCSEHV